MEQSAPKDGALLGIEPFWERATLEPPLRWERWRILPKLATLAKKGFAVDIIRKAPSDKVTLPPMPIHEKDVDNSTA